MAPHVLIDPDHPHPVEAVRIGDQDALAFGEHRFVGGVPGHRQCLSDPGHAQVSAHKSFQCPLQSAA